MFKIYLLNKDGSKECLGQMERKHITYNRYSEGLLIGAGKLHETDIKKGVFLKFAAQFQNKSELEFEGEDVIYSGTFRCINFIPENNAVVFGSIGPVYELTPEFAAEEEEEEELEGAI